MAAWDFVAGDVDRDGLDDLALVGNGEWFAWMSGQNYAMHGPFDLELCGGIYALGDVDGDRQPDLLMLSGANWFGWRSGNSHCLEGPVNCGVSNGVPCLHDFDMDGRDDPCVVVGHTWHVWRSASNYAKQLPFGFDPGASTDLYPVAFSFTLFPNTQWQRIFHCIGFMVNGWLHYRRTDILSTAITPLQMAPGVPVTGLFDGHQGPDLLTVERLTDSYRYHTFLSSDGWEKRGPFTLRSGNAPGVAGMVWQDTNGCYAAAAVYDVGDITNALVDVNGTPLVFNRTVSFNTSTGYQASLRLPFYYAELTNVQSGDMVTLSVFTNSPAGPALMYRSAPVTMPAQVLMIQPAAGDRVLVGRAVPMSWTPADGCQGYLVSYDGPDDYTPQWDGGWHINYVPAPQTGYTIPAGCTITGLAEFGVAALNGDVPALIGEHDTNDCFMVAGSWDETETVVDVPVTDPLFIAKEYSVKEKGLRFHVRESDPYRMPYPGVITIHLKLRKWKISAASVEAYDMNGTRYFQWEKARIFKRKNRHYTVTFPCSPGSTIAIGTHKASFHGATYTY